MLLKQIKACHEVIGISSAFGLRDNAHHSLVFSSGQAEVLAHAGSSRPAQREGKKQARIPRDVRVVFLRCQWVSVKMHSDHRS